MVQVFHNPNFLNDCLKGEISDFKACIHVANINVSRLEHAYGLTQNIDGKVWDSNELIEALIPKQARRSTAWGDLMILDGARYYVDGIGFKLLDPQMN